jgi:hypothetical protein
MPTLGGAWARSHTAGRNTQRFSCFGAFACVQASVAPFPPPLTTAPCPQLPLRCRRTPATVMGRRQLSRRAGTLQDESDMCSGQRYRRISLLLFMSHRPTEVLLQCAEDRWAQVELQSLFALPSRSVAHLPVKPCVLHIAICRLDVVDGRSPEQNIVQHHRRRGKEFIATFAESCGAHDILEEKVR